MDPPQLAEMVFFEAAVEVLVAAAAVAAAARVSTLSIAEASPLPRLRLILVAMEGRDACVRAGKSVGACVLVRRKKTKRELRGQGDKWCLFPHLYRHRQIRTKNPRGITAPLLSGERY